MTLARSLNDFPLSVDTIVERAAGRILQRCDFRGAIPPAVWGLQEISSSLAAHTTSPSSLDSRYTTSGQIAGGS